MRQGPIQSYISLATRHFIEEDVYACVRGVAFAIAPELVTLGEYLDRVVLRLTGRGVGFSTFVLRVSGKSRRFFMLKCIAFYD